MRQVLLIVLFCTACEAQNTRTVAEGDLAPRNVAQSSVGAASAQVGAGFICLQDDTDRVRLTGILRQRVRAAASATGEQGQRDTIVVLETPIRTVDCKNRAGGQPPPMLEPRSLVILHGAGVGLRSFVGDTVVVFGEAPTRGAILDAEPLSMRLDSLRIISGGQRLRVAASGTPLP